MLSNPSTSTYEFALSRNKRILLASSLLSIFRSLQSLLRKKGYYVDVARDGAEALIQIKRYPPDLLLLHVSMDVIDGYEVTRQVRRSPDLPFISVILVSDDDQFSVVKGLALGANDVIRLPVKKRELLARIQALLRLKCGIDERSRTIQQHEDLVTRLTHDLRTPLLANNYTLDLLRRDAFGKTQNSLEQVAHSNQNLLEMVDTVLEVYQYERGYKELSFLVVDLWELSQSVVKELTPLAEDKGLTLELTREADICDRSPQVRGDRVELRRLLTNLIGNAIRYTDEGSIEVWVKSRCNSATGDQSVIVEIKDTGIGIAPEEQMILFERFKQGNHQRQGNGLGLYLSRQIVKAHQGSITVESEIGNGSIFTICLPCA